MKSMKEVDLCSRQQYESRKNRRCSYIFLNLIFFCTWFIYIKCVSFLLKIFVNSENNISLRKHLIINKAIMFNYSNVLLPHFWIAQLVHIRFTEGFLRLYSTQSQLIQGAYQMSLGSLYISHWMDQSLRYIPQRSEPCASAVISIIQF